MKIRAEGGAIVITLSPEEAARVVVDHGEYEMCLPSDDPLGDLLQLNDALKGVRGQRPPVAARGRS